MENKTLSEKESLDIISNMILKAKNSYYESGLGALLWGFTNLICFGLAYFQETVSWFRLPFNPFYLMFVTILLQVYFDRKEKKYKKVVTYKDEMCSHIWISFGIAVLILTIAGGIADIGYVVLPVLLILFGIPTFSTGLITNFTPFIIGGIICWCLSVPAFFYLNSYAHLMVAAGALAAWIIPGFILRARFYKNIAKQNDGV